jgi:predicted DNA-binding transcriptional regulator AlpA
VISRSRGGICRRNSGSSETVQINILSGKKASQKVGLSERQMGRMAQKGTFPRPLDLTEGSAARKGRHGWVDAELDAWIAQRIAERDQTVSATIAGPPPQAAEVSMKGRTTRGAAQSNQRRRKAAPSIADARA